MREEAERMAGETGLQEESVTVLDKHQAVSHI